MQRMANIGCLVAATIALLGNTANAATEDQLKIVIDERGPWDLAAPELGQQAGIFKKHGIILDLTYSEAEKEAVVAHNADIGVGIDVMEVLRAYAYQRSACTHHRRKYDRLGQLLVCGDEFANQNSQGHHRRDDRIFEEW